MKKLLLKICLLLFLTAGIMITVHLLFMSADYTGYAAAAIDKHERLLNTESPRFIFVGGSNLAFGIDSKMIEDEIGISTVNMGLSAGLGLRYNLFEVRPYIKKGDIIVIAPEYEHFFGTSFDGTGELLYPFLNFPESRKYLKSVNQYLVILRNYPRMLRAKVINLLIKPPPSDRCRKDFNEYGDFVGKLSGNVSFYDKIKSCEIRGAMNKDVIPVLNDFVDCAEKSGAKVFFVYPCYMYTAYRKNKDKIDSISDLLKRKMKATVLSALSDYVFPDDCFYDTVYHLTKEAKENRSQKLISDLKKIL
jgi:hypothetical protein